MRDRAELLGRAAQAWCTDKTWHIEMMPELAESFADILAADLAKAREEGRRDGLEGVRKIMTYDEAATSRGLGQGNTWDVIKRTYTIDADVFDALLGEKEEGDDGPEAKTH